MPSRAALIARAVVGVVESKRLQVTCPANARCCRAKTGRPAPQMEVCCVDNCASRAYTTFNNTLPQYCKERMAVPKGSTIREPNCSRRGEWVHYHPCASPPSLRGLTGAPAGDTLRRTSAGRYCRLARPHPTRL